jgi:cobalt-precorrin 5A hydrolase
MAITPGGRKLAKKLTAATGWGLWLPQSLCRPTDKSLQFASLREAISHSFREREALVLIMACGIAVRLLAPLLHDKQSDPAVVVMDEAGQFAISLLSGHWGGANELAVTLAGIAGGTPVITTATDIRGLAAVDVFARDIGVIPEPFFRVKVLNAAMLRGEDVAVFTDRPFARLHRYPGLSFLPLARLKEAGSQYRYRALLTNRARLPGARGDDLYLRPPSLYVGVGCRRGVSAERIIAAIHEVLMCHNLAPASIAGLASIEHKRDEFGLIKAAHMLKVPIRFYHTQEIAALSAPYQVSTFVQETMGVGAVCEPTAMLAARSGRLLVAKQKMNGVTVAVAEAAYPWSASAPVAKKR